MKIIIELEVSYEIEVEEDSTTDDWWDIAGSIAQMVVDKLSVGEPSVLVSDIYEEGDYN